MACPSLFLYSITSLLSSIGYLTFHCHHYHLELDGSGVSVYCVPNFKGINICLASSCYNGISLFIFSANSLVGFSDRGRMFSCGSFGQCFMKHFYWLFICRRENATRSCGELDWDLNWFLPLLAVLHGSDVSWHLLLLSVVCCYFQNASETNNATTNLDKNKKCGDTINEIKDTWEDKIAKVIAKMAKYS